MSPVAVYEIASDLLSIGSLIILLTLGIIALAMITSQYRIVMGLFSWPSDICVCIGLYLLRSFNSISYSQSLEIISFKVLQPNKIKNSLILSLNISWYLVIFISSSTTYCRTSKDLS